MKDEIVLYQPDETIKLEVRLKDETVWLTQQQIADLFGVKQPAISKHISNIYKSGELAEKGTYSILEYMGHDGQQLYSTKAYNLDMILSVGYRVNSAHATQFRRWATSILKDYLLRGYAVNQQLLHLEERIDKKIHAIENTLADHQEKIDFFVRTSLPPVEQVFFGGEFFAARVLLEKLIKTAKKRVIIIDEYIDAATFEMLDVREKGVPADIYSSGLNSTLRDAHNKTAGVEPIQTHKWTNASHDRWLIIDDQLYHCGHSLKDMGKKLCAVSLMGTSPEVILAQVQ